MFLKILSTVLCLQLILVEGNLLTNTNHNDSCTDGILDAAIALIKQGSSLSNKCGEENGASCVLDAAVELINKAKSKTPKNRKDEVQAVDCEELLLAGFTESGNYTIWPRSKWDEGKALNVYCDMQTDGGGWTVIQRRGDFGKLEDYFFQDWLSYKSGFGNIKQDFWLGNENIYRITNQKQYSVRFDLKTVDREEGYALYGTFWIEDEIRKYTVHIDDYSGDAGDSMKVHNRMQFSTKDADNDAHRSTNCAQMYKGAWWYNACYDSNLNGLYRSQQNAQNDGIMWHTFKGFKPLQAAEIKIRPKNFTKKQ